ncbi:MAG: PocR ligand-binding domain-containing protein, partial [Eubacteriales bacterium]
MAQFILDAEIKDMLINFYRISGIRVGIHDLDGGIIDDYPHESPILANKSFCEKSKCYSPIFVKKCNRCDRDAFEQARFTRRSYVYECHMGFMEAVIPILAGDEVLCFLVIGQVKKKIPEAKTTEEYIYEFFKLNKISGPGYSVEQAEKDYERMPCMSRDTFKSFVYFLELCAQKIYNDNYMHRDRRSISRELMKYINANLYNRITIADAAESLNLSSSYLSHSISREMGTTFTRYLNACRIEEAKRILRVTDMNIKKVAELLQY